jgi:hypothetical protein
MKAIPLLSVLVLSISAALSQEYPAYRIKSEFNHLDKTITGHGLCVPIKVNGKKVVVTAAHVVRDDSGKEADEIFVDLPVGWIRCKIQKIDIAMDLCILEPKISPPETVDFYKDNNKQAQEVVNPNFYSKMAMKINEGAILLAMSDGKWMASIPDYNHGSSGSPIYTKDGKLCGIGIAGFSEDGGKTMLFAIIIGNEYLRKFIHSEK